MIRQPSTRRALFAWHTAALRGDAPPIHPDEPECGWFKTRLVKGGPWVAVKIWVEQEIDSETGELTAPETVRCEADGMRRNPNRLWTFLTPISRAEYDALINRREAIPAMAATMAPIDLTAKAIRP